MYEVSRPPWGEAGQRIPPAQGAQRQLVVLESTGVEQVVGHATTDDGTTDVAIGAPVFTSLMASLNAA